MKQRLYSRREMLSKLGTASLGLGILPGIMNRSSMHSAQSGESVASPDYKPYFGDVHNHNAVGYAQGGLRRSFEIAQNQRLDFYALTPHAHWNDIEEYEEGIEDVWHRGFEVTRNRWPDLLEMVREFNEPGSLVTFPGYEWHSTHMGDYHILFPYDDARLYLPDTLEELQDFVRESKAIMIPHHPANVQGLRGANFDRRDPELAPLLEVYSEWGNAVSDKGPYPYIRHSPGGRWTKNTFEYRLAQGDRLGVVASTDDHLGKAGAYSQGLAVALATELTREAIFDAFWNRRTYAVTGDRIQLDFKLNGQVMGSELPYVREREIEVGVTGWDRVDKVEILKNNKVIHREFPMDKRNSRSSWENPVLIWFEYGWGPWASLDMAEVADWDVRFDLEQGILEDFQPAFKTGPFDESRRDRVTEQSDRGMRLRSHTARQQEFEDQSQKGVVLKVKGGMDTRLKIQTTSPSNKSWEFTLGELLESNEVLLTGSFPRESALLHRPVFQENYKTNFKFVDEDAGEGLNWYYVRVTQANRQFAWSSPIWVENA